MHKNIGTEIVKVRDYMEEQNLAERIILKCNLKKYRVRTRTAFIRICTGSSTVHTTVDMVMNSPLFEYVNKHDGISVITDNNKPGEV
jgi:hypothetical protein